jgi:hypothetical protein
MCILEWIEKHGIRTSKRDGISIVAEMTNEQVSRMREEIQIKSGTQVYRYVKTRKYL